MWKSEHFRQSRPRIASFFVYFSNANHMVARHFWSALKLKVRQSRNDFFKPSLLPKTNEINLTTMIPQVDLFSFVFGRNWDTKRHVEIDWPLISGSSHTNNQFLQQFFGLFTFWVFWHGKSIPWRSKYNKKLQYI